MPAGIAYMVVWQLVFFGEMEGIGVGSCIVFECRSSLNVRIQKEAQPEKGWKAQGATSKKVPRSNNLLHARVGVLRGSCIPEFYSALEKICENGDGRSPPVLLEDDVKSSCLLG